MGIKFDNEVLTLMVLTFILDSWETLKISMTNSTPRAVINMEYVKNSILN